MQAISEILTGIQTPAETGAGASSRPMMDGYNELTQWANDAINANSWRISPDQVLSGESERLLLELAAENNRRLRETQQEAAENNTERLLKRHRLETLEVIAAYLKLRFEQNRKGSSAMIEWPDWSDAAIQGASIQTSEIGRPRGCGIPFPSISCKTIGQSSAGRTVIGRAGMVNRKPVVLCRCSCGRRFLAFELDVIHGGAERCGPDCPDGKPKPPAHKLLEVFRNMHDRCSNPRHKNFDRYGGRGIRVCPEWSSFDAFAEWATGSGYAEGLTIDRIDNDGDYTPENCRWATRSEQNNNRSTCIMVEYDGKKMTLKQAAAAAGLPYQALRQRYRAKGEQDLFRPIQKRKGVSRK